MAVSQGKPIIALFLTMICCIVLGMGVPTTANYCIMAATCAPILIAPEIGINLVCAHFFVFYFGIVADITYILAFNPAMVFINTNAFQVVQICITSLLGIFGIAAALNGFLFGKLNLLFKILLIAGGLCMMDPGMMTDIVGLILVIGPTAWQYMRSKRTASA